MNKSQRHTLRERSQTQKTIHHAMPLIENSRKVKPRASTRKSVVHLALGWGQGLTAKGQEEFFLRGGRDGDRSMIIVLAAQLLPKLIELST